ncbi:MAG TPA: hypothetical protein VGX96_15190 [Candidatus Elarobacter sp.]|jgi:hypothetical protein|nr:hypothetical protein [Candidatus Elarobacter sp.]
MAEYKQPRISHAPETGKLEIATPITPEKAAAIKKCLDRGELRMTFNSVDLKAGKLGEAWEYD